MPAADEARAAKDVSLDATEPSVAEEPPAALGGQEGGSTILNEPRPIPEATIGETEEAFTNMPFAVEFCSGTAGLTAQLRKLGLAASFGVDHVVKAGSKAPVRKLDLSSPGALELGMEWISNPGCMYVHFGIPCGTCSRAREIPIQGGGPKPLRSEQTPEGLQGLSDADQRRVDLANAVYETCCKLILHCIAEGVDWSLEQPRRSLFWWTKYWKSIVESSRPWYASFHSCMYGGARPKATTIASSLWEIKQLDAECNGQHVHLPWGRTPHGFATADEVEYPINLCKEWAKIIFEVITKKCNPSVSVFPKNPDKRARACANKQTKKSLAFMPEWSHVETFYSKDPPSWEVGAKLKVDTPLGDHNIPAYSRILRITHNKEGGEERGWQIAVGIAWSEESYIGEATRRGHPANIFQGMPKLLEEAIKNNVTLSPDQLVLKRAAWLKKWTSRALELSRQEAELHDHWPQHRRKILQGKRFLVLQEMIKDMQFPDPGIAKEMIEGFNLIGNCGGGSSLPHDFQPATLTADDLELHAAQSNKAIMHSTKSSGDHVVDKELWKKTKEEEEKGWLTELDSLPDDRGRVSRRFAVVQSEKVRPIDNYSESQINDATTVLNKCTVDGVDTIAAAIASTMKALRARGKSSKLHGRSFDLKSAYRQLAVSDSSLRWARLAVYCPEDKKTHCFQQFSLPFGARSSVVAFLRCARMLQWFAMKLDIIATCYFDDYVCISQPELAANTSKCFETLLDLLGRKYDKSGDKSDQMSETVSALGVLFDLSKTGSGKLFVSNTEKRKVDVCEQVAEALARGVLSQHAAASLKGRLGFAEGQLFGRGVKRLINELGKHALHPPKRNELQEETLCALRDVSERIEKAPPRMVDCHTDETCLMFTDACFDSEAKEGGIGGVLINRCGYVTSWFGHKVSSAFCSSFMAEDQEQAIGELEAFAVLAGLDLWKKHLSAKHLICFVDNEGARYLILKGYSGNPTISRIVHNIALLEESYFILPWYSRVPTECNIADKPSRGIEHEALSADIRCEVVGLEKLLHETYER